MDSWNIRTPRVSIYIFDDDGTRIYTFEQKTVLNCEIQRVADATKFFGQVVCQRLHFTLLDVDREFNITAGKRVHVIFKTDGGNTSTLPRFYVSEVHRDENTNQLSVTAYDKIKELEKYTVADIDIPSSFSISDILNLIKNKIGLTSTYVTHGTIANLSRSGYTREKLNVDDNTLLKDVLIAIAEVTGTIIYISDWYKLHLRSLATQADQATVLTRDDYMSLTSKTNRRLVKIISATELGDNLEVHTDLTGTSQVIWENPFLTLLSDSSITDIITHLLNQYGDFTIGQFDMQWFGDTSIVQIGSPLSITCKDGSVLSTYVLDDTITYDGSLCEKTQFKYEDPDDVDSNPATISDAMKHTSAKVDKANQQITLLVDSTVNDYVTKSQLRIDLDGIRSTVSSESAKRAATDDEILGKLENLTQIAQTANDVNILIQTALEDRGEQDHVTTSTGFTFNQDGLHIQKSDSDISTTIDNDGMVIELGDTKMLTVDHNGVDATNLTAHKYLQIPYTRFQPYNCPDKPGAKRTGLFYWGGTEI